MKPSLLLQKTSLNLENRSEIAKLHNTHKNPNLNEILEKTPSFSSMSEVVLNYDSYPWRHIERLILEKIYLKNNYNDPKEFTLDMLVTAYFEEFKDLGVSDDSLGYLVEKKAGETIDHGLKYGIFEEKGEGWYKLLCRGKLFPTVKHYLEEKYRETT